MIKIMFVCHGNICRSTMAEFVMKDLVHKAGMDEQIFAASSACRRDEIGSDTHPGTKAKLRQMEIPFTKRRAVQLTQADYAEYDYIAAMDRENLRQSMQVINEAADVVKEGKNVILFPEGTRSRKGNQLLEFKSGSFKIAVKAKCPIVPVALKNCFVPFDSNTVRPVTVEVHFLDPIPYEEYQGMKTTEIAEMVKKRIEAVVTA